MCTCSECVCTSNASGTPDITGYIYTCSEIVRLMGGKNFWLLPRSTSYCCYVVQWPVVWANYSYMIIYQVVELLICIVNGIRSSAAQGEEAQGYEPMDVMRQRHGNQFPWELQGGLLVTNWWQDVLLLVCGVGDGGRRNARVWRIKEERANEVGVW